jgi:hypothetical protein
VSCASTYPPPLHAPFPSPNRSWTFFVVPDRL